MVLFKFDLPRVLIEMGFYYLLHEKRIKFLSLKTHKFSYLLICNHLILLNSERYQFLKISFENFHTPLEHTENLG